MARWAYMLGGLIVWTIHFVGVYAIASLADVVARADDFLWRMIGLGFSVICLVATLAIAVIAIRDARGREEGEYETHALIPQLAAMGAAVAALAIAWQAMPTLIGY